MTALPIAALHCESKCAQSQHYFESIQCDFAMPTVISAMQVCSQLQLIHGHISNADQAAVASA